MTPERERAMRVVFRNHQAGAKQRGVPFRFTFKDWRDWWLEDGRWARRDAEGLVMARTGDVGAYERGNVYCATRQQNTEDYWRGRVEYRNEMVHLALPAGSKSRIAALRGEEPQTAFLRRVLLNAFAQMERDISKEPAHAE